MDAACQRRRPYRASAGQALERGCSGSTSSELRAEGITDVRRTDAGTWFLDISASYAEENGSGGPRKTIKTASSRRRVPIHPELIKIGFLAYVDRRREIAGDDPWLFAGLRPDKYGNRATYALKRFSAPQMFIPAAIKLEKGQTFYSLRHSFRDALRRCEAPADTLRAIGGWSQAKVVSDSYGDPSDPDHQRQWIERVAYPGLDLTFLHRTTG